MIHIRTVAKEDATEVCEICKNDLGYACDVSLVEKRVAEIDCKREIVFVAEVEDKTVGFIHAEVYDVLYFESAVNILGLAVAAEYRKRGVGKQLLEAAENWGIERGISMVRLNSGSARTDAHEFYRNLGYGDEKEQIRFLKRM